MNLTMQIRSVELGTENAVAWAIEWVARMQFFFNLWSLHGTMEYRYIADELMSYIPSHEWILLCASAISGGALATRIAVIEAIRPSNP